MYKEPIFSKIVLDRINTTLDDNRPIEQVGFRKNFATIDHIHTVKYIVEKYNEYNKPLYMAFIDYTKAFDSISHEEIWDSLKNQEIPTLYIKIIKSIYAKSKARIKLESLGETFKIERGVRQGDPLSLKLFSEVLENVFRKLYWNHYGSDIDGRKLNHLRFADDIILFEENPSKLQIIIEELNNESNKVGLSININKTKLLTYSENQEISINNLSLEYVTECTYLGQIISHKDQTTKEIKIRPFSNWVLPNWRRVARDRKQWKMLEEAFANRHTELRDILQMY
ncbi:Retrovirus-related Pol polyprotein from type-2 retrotransposable element R2DM; Endonuclease [Eumeta japonica]|uniref:Retrovirus-related Pol polyprotein from type-2 retrotransposable element R2DM Endonuclease n=1 Tax=Eumeta variegata TaxID=151549 RepID=A0A4C1YE78_EUMVA|nr:Retrovirus-related Pol polyprotein from type-2 retrotransposable element R2DM; Endonuclease [Eumeta japonica]